MRRARNTPSCCTGVVAAACTQGKRAQHAKPQCVIRDDQPDAREGQAGRTGVAERFVVPMKLDEAGQYTLRHMLETGPVLLLLLGPPVPTARLQQLAAARPRLSDAGLRVLAVGLDASAPETSGGARAPLFVVDVSSEVTFSLALFRATEDGAETELLLDRGGNVRARWTSSTPEGLAAPGSLITAAERISRIPVAAPGHASHPH